MPLEDLIIPFSLAMVLNCILGFYYVKIRITAIEEKSWAELEIWKREAALEIRKDSGNRSLSTLKGKIAERMAPVLSDFCYAPSDAWFIRSLVDYTIFDGLTRVADDKEYDIQIVFIDVKKGNGTLTRTQRLIKQAVEKKSVS